MQMLKVGFAALHGIDPCCVDAAVPEYVRQTRYVLVQAVIGACEQMPQIVRKDLFIRYAGDAAQLFHIAPNV